MNTSMKVLLCGAVISAGAVSANAATKHISVVIPPDFDAWLSDTPIISLDGGKTGTALKLDQKHCGWLYADVEADKLSDDVVFFRKGDSNREDMIGLNGNWETGATATPIPLATLFEAYNTDSLYFVADQEQFIDGEDGWYTTYPEGVEGSCTYSLQSVVYDTDAKLHPAFSCYGPGGESCQFGIEGVVDQDVAQKAVNRCIGVTTGIVESVLDTTVNQFKRKPKLTTKGAACFINEKFFNQLFTPTEGVNEASCTDIPLVRKQNFQWTFDSDIFQSKGTTVPGGFFPVEESTDEMIKSNLQTPLAAARIKRSAEGPIFYGPDLRELDEATGVPKINLVCNGAGWTGGADCEGHFADGDDTEALIKSLYPKASCVIGWACQDEAPEGWTFYKTSSETVVASDKGGVPRWYGNRNQHFCTETHVVFDYIAGQTFSVLGDDDIWVFIDNKLAIDLGGTHLAAPGFVDLSKFEGLSGKLVEGNRYNLDMFSCDRRTTMSNLAIRTNIFMRSLPSYLQILAKKDYATNVSSYELCYNKAEFDCMDLIKGVEENSTCKPVPNTIQYFLSTNGIADTDNSELLENGKINHGGIDLTNPAAPQVNNQKLDLPEGRYTLFAAVEGKFKKITSIRVSGNAEAITIKPVATANMKIQVAGSSISITAQGAKTYAVMDMMGRVLSKGKLMNGHANVVMTRKGSFMVRADNQVQRVILK